MLKIGLAKGRISEDASSMLARLGFDVDDIHRSRKLIFDSNDGAIRLVLLKAVDIPLFVHDGSLDLGILGMDSVLESGRDVREVMRLDFSRCRLCMAGPKERVPLRDGIRVATKYPDLTRKIMAMKNVDATIISLSGSIELAPLIKLSDIIVDLVQSGKTLKENDLEIYETLMEISATVIANPGSTVLKKNEVNRFLDICSQMEGLSEAI